MSNYNDLVIFQKTYDLILWTYPVVNGFPKSQKFVLGQRIENLLISVVRSIILINKERGQERIIGMKQISSALDELMVLFRLSKDLRFIGIKKYGIAIEKVNEIGKLLRGWQKSLI